MNWRAVLMITGLGLIIASAATWNGWYFAGAIACFAIVGSKVEKAERR